MTALTLFENVTHWRTGERMTLAVEDGVVVPAPAGPAAHARGFERRGDAARARVRAAHRAPHHLPRGGPVAPRRRRDARGTHRHASGPARHPRGGGERHVPPRRRPGGADRGARPLRASFGARVLR